MQKPVRRTSRLKIRRHLLSLSIISMALVSAAGFSAWHTAVTEAKIASIQKESVARSAADDTKIQAIVARKAAELQARQEVAAKAAAEQAQNATDSTASIVDSSTCNVLTTHANPASIDVVVNKKHCIQPVTYVPNELVSIGSGYTLSAKAAPSFHALMEAAAAAGQAMTVTSSYRSYSDQVSTYAYWVNTSGKAGADTYSARPGYSEHQTGLAFDVADATKQHVLNQFGVTSQYQWLQSHAADYGFIQRYYVGEESMTGYEAEEWHYRYVGITVAKDMQTKGVRTLEQYWGVSGGDYY